MANTVSLLSYANTFGDWVVTTNALARENNILASSNYIKSTGTLYLNDPSLGLQVSKDAVIAGQLQVQGIGSSAYIQNNLRVDTQVYFQNTILGLTNSGELISNGRISASASGIGLAVANNATIDGYLRVTSNSSIIGATDLQNTLSVTGPTTLSNTLAVTGNSTLSSNVYAQNNLFVTKDISVSNLTGTGVISSYGLNVIGNGNFTGQVSVAGNFVLNGSTVYNTNTFTINANSSVGLDSTFNVNRGSSANATLRWNEASTYWDIRDVDNPTSYSKILTANLITNSVSTVNSNLLASATAANTLNNSIISLIAATTYANSSLKSYVDNSDAVLNSTITAANTSLKSYTDNTITAANTSLKSYVDNSDAVLVSRINAANTNASDSSYQTTGTLSAARLPTSGVSAGYWGGTTQIPVLNIDTTGRVISAANVAVSSTLSTAGSSGTGSVSLINQSLTVTSSNTSIITVVGSGQTLTVTPQASGVTAGSYGSSTAIPVLNVDSFGRVTSLTTNAVSTTITLAAGSGSGSVSGGGTLTVSGGTGITTSASGSTFTVNNSGVTGLTGTTNQVSVSGSTGSVTLSLPQNVHTGTNFQVNSLGVGTGPTGTAGEIRATNNITAYYSDDRLKTRLGNIENALAKVMTLNGFQYEANETAQALGYTVKPEIGLSAQEVQAVLPEVVVPAPIDDKYLTIHYERVIPLLVEAIKELSREVEELKKK
jgi:hypothetical protein